RIRVAFARLVALDALVMIVHRHGQSLFRMFLADAMEVQLPFDFRGFRDVEFRQLLPMLRTQFLVEDVLADDDATVANVNPRPLNELLDFRVRFSAEAAKRELGGPGHWIS